MEESRSLWGSVRRILLPLLIAAALVVATVLVSGSALIRIEDVYINRVLAGAYGTPDWRVQEMNPLLAQLLSLLYRILPAINWYGALLLGLLMAAAATSIGLSARKPGGLLPAVLAVSPLLLLLTNSMQSTVVCAVCTVAGALTLMEGIQHKKAGVGRMVLGGVLLLFGLMLSMKWGIILTVATAVCWLPSCVREARIRGLAIGLPVIAIVAAALFGYSALMYHAPELSAYRSDYARYDRLQHSALKEESDALLAAYGTAVYTEDHSDHDHPEDEIPEDELSIFDHGSENHVHTSFEAVDWSINDASLFFTRFGSDSELVAPEALKTLETQTGGALNMGVGEMFGGLFETLKKPQFLLLIGICVIVAVAVLVTEGKGLLVLLAALLGLGGHIFSILTRYNAFADIAPYYLAALVILLYHFDGNKAKDWYRRIAASATLRGVISVAVLLVFIAGMGGLFYYTNKTPANASESTREAYDMIMAYVEDNPDTLFVGDNPHDRYKPDTLAAPKRGQDSNLLAGSYDLYSPRAAAMMEAYGIENPLKDAVDREDIAYISMSFDDSKSLRLASAYGLYVKEPTVLASLPYLSERVIGLNAYTEEEMRAMLAAAAADQEQAELWSEALQEMEEDGTLEEILAEEEATAEPAVTAAPTATATATAAPTATATPRPTATATPRPTATATPAATATATPRPTATATPRPTATVRPTATPTATATNTNG